MTTNDLAKEIRRFAGEHPQGWGHDEWLGFLHTLSEAGNDVSDGDAIGMALENERLSQLLGGMKIKGLGSKRIAALVERFGTLWNLKSASQEELDELPDASRPLAEQAQQALQ